MGNEEILEGQKVIADMRDVHPAAPDLNDTTPNDSPTQDNVSPQKRELKFLLSMKPNETFDQFKKRVKEALRANGMLRNYTNHEKRAD